MNFTVLDLEMNQPSGKIIQIGAVVGNISTGELVDKLSILVALDEPLNPYITNLTNITPKQLNDDGIDLVDAHAQLVTFHKKHQAHPNPLTWGGGDHWELRRQVGGLASDFAFGRGYFDYKKIYQAWRLSQGKPLQGGLAKSMLQLGLKFEGTKHNALDDAYNTFRVACMLQKKFRP